MPSSPVSCDTDVHRKDQPRKKRLFQQWKDEGFVKMYKVLSFTLKKNLA